MQYIETQPCEACKAKTRIYDNGNRELVVPIVHKIRTLARVYLEKQLAPPRQSERLFK